MNINTFIYQANFALRPLFLSPPRISVTHFASPGVHLAVSVTARWL